MNDPNDYSEMVSTADSTEWDDAAIARLKALGAPPLMYCADRRSGEMPPVPPVHLPKAAWTYGGSKPSEGANTSSEFEYATPQPGDDDELRAYRKALSAFLKSRDDAIVADAQARQLAGEVEYLRTMRKARALVDAEEADEAFSPPPYLPTLADDLAENVEPPQPRIESLSAIGHNVLLAAQAKTGKTTTVTNLVRSLADGVPFLDRLAVTVPAGRIGVLNYEMSKQQFTAWQRDAGIIKTDRVSVLNLRGYRMPLKSPAVQNYIVKWAQDCEIEILIADPWGRMMVGSGSENSNDDVRAVLEIVGEIKRRAGISDVFLIAHMGHGQQQEIGQERARGASELLGWPDVLWNLTAQTGTRYLSAVGRDVEFPEQALTYDAATRQLSLSSAGGDRRTDEARRRIDEVVQIVRANPGADTATVMNAITSTTNRVHRNEAVKAAATDGRVRREKVGRSLLHYVDDGKAGADLGSLIEVSGL